jgi:hypothetical protein
MRRWIDRAADAVVEHMNGAPLRVIPYDEPRRSPDRRGCVPGRFLDRIDDKATP